MVGISRMRPVLIVHDEEDVLAPVSQEMIFGVPARCNFPSRRSWLRGHVIELYTSMRQLYQVMINYKREISPSIIARYFSANSRQRPARFMVSTLVLSLLVAGSAILGPEYGGALILHLSIARVATPELHMSMRTLLGTG